MGMFGTGPAKALQNNAFARAAKMLKCHPADLEAIAIVESDGFGWFKDGRIKLLFEKHVFYKRLPATIRKKAVKAGLARRKWVSPRNGGYRDQKGATSRYKLFEAALKMHERAGYESASYGTYQIMGFNYKPCGFNSAKEMFEAFLTGEQAQLDAFIAFLRSRRLIVAIRKRDFDLVEKRYNGGGLKGAYAKLMLAASNKLRRTKWKNWNPNAAIPMAVDPPIPDHVPVTPKQPQKPVNAAPAALVAALSALAGTIYAGWDWLTSLIGF